MSLWGRRFASRTLGLVVLENALIVGSVLLGVWIRLGSEGWWHTVVFEAGAQKALVVAVVCQVCFYFADLYDSRAYSDRRWLLVGLIQGVGTTSLVLAVLYFWFPALIIGRGVFLTSAGLVLLLVGGGRVAFEWLTLRTGAGVVVDSDPEYEFQECLGKARALVEAIDYAREGVD